MTAFSGRKRSIETILRDDDDDENDDDEDHIWRDVTAIVNLCDAIMNHDS